MSREYLQVCSRLIENRKKLNKTQKQVAEELHIAPAQYCKYESGLHGIPYEILVEMHEDTEWDVDYIFVGKSRVENEPKLEDLARQVREEQVLDLYRILFCGFYILSKDAQLEESHKCELEMLRIRLETEECPTAMYLARKAMGVSQIHLGEAIGVSERKYGRLERNQQGPGSKLLKEICDQSKCRPSLFLSQEQIEIRIMSHIWEVFDQEKREKLLSFVKKGVEELLN